jgi:SAM-dependent methyltransferase
VTPAVDLQRIYSERFSGIVEYRKQVWQILTSRFFSQWITPSSTVLDLGCGYCEFINSIQAETKYGMDLNPDSTFNAGPNVRVLQQDCSQAWPLPAGKLDAIFTSNLFEHLSSKRDLEATLQQARLCLKPGGALIALGPNMKYLPGAYWDFWDHYLPLTDRSLVEVLRKCDFVIESVIPRFLPYTMSDGRTYPLWMVRAYLSLPATWPLFGRQFLVVARRSSEMNS